MGGFKLYQQPHSAIRGNDVFHAFFSSFTRSLDDAIKEVGKMAETKLAFFILTLIGIPAYIYAWFIDINTNVDLIKAIILGTIGAFTGLVIALRYMIKLFTEYKEFIKKYYPEKQKTKLNNNKK